MCESLYYDLMKKKKNREKKAVLIQQLYPSMSLSNVN